MPPPFFTIPFTSYTATSEWTSFLRHLSQPGIIPAHSGVGLIPRTVSSRDSRDKRFWTALHAARAAGAAAGSPARAQLRGWQRTLTLPAAVPLLRDAGTLLVFVGPGWTAAERDEAERTRRAGGVRWHCFAAFWRSGVWGVYDPSFVAGPLRGMRGLGLFRALLDEMRARGRAVDEVWVGGGGNTNGECAEMSRRWVQEEVVSKMGVDLGTWEGREGWIRVYDI